MKKIQSLLLGAAFAAAAIGFNAPAADACSRVLYVGSDSLRIVGRSLDWKTPIPTNLYVYPRGITKEGNTLAGSVKWTSRYGAVYAVGYDGGVTEGMNEKGLVINGLFCKGTVYINDSTSGRPPMSLAMFVAWLLDMNATTADVVNVLQQHNFNISGATFDGGTVSALHWIVTDATGATCVFEFDHGNINIYQGQDIPILTNDPAFPKINAINDYWVKVGGENMLPGGVKSPDRFVRGYYFDGHVAKTADADLGVAITRSIVANVSVPYMYTVDGGEPNVSSTQWRSFANIRDLRYYFDIVTNMGLYYIDLSTINLKPGAPILKLDTSKSGQYVGCINDLLQPSPGFTPMY